MKKEIYDYMDLIPLYPEIFSWLTGKTLGGVAKKGYFQYFDKELWLPIKELIISVREKKNKSKLDYEFLSCCYTGELYRIQTYNPRKKGFVYPMGYYQSWAGKEGLEEISRMGGSLLLLCGHATEKDVAIDTFRLLCFMFKYFDINIPDICHEPSQLCRYEKECEIVMPIHKESIDNLVVIDAKNIIKWRTDGNSLPKDKWYRKDLR